jgi:hypothetical protein
MGSESKSKILLAEFDPQGFRQGISLQVSWRENSTGVMDDERLPSLHHARRTRAKKRAENKGSNEIPDPGFRLP